METAIEKPNDVTESTCIRLAQADGSALRKAWAKECEIAEEDDRVIYGEPSKFCDFASGWDAQGARIKTVAYKFLAEANALEEYRTQPKAQGAAIAYRDMAALLMSLLPNADGEPRA